jgi:SRSO17 transposase
MANTSVPPERRFREYLDILGRAVGHQDRRDPLRCYLTGLCLPGERKSVEPMAARVDPRHVRARHQSMHHFVTNASWEDAAVLRVARDWVLDALERHGPVAAWIVDDTTPASPRRDATRSAWPGSTAGCWASRRTARWPSR